MKNIEIRKYSKICRFSIPCGFIEGFYEVWSRDQEEFDILEALWRMMN